MSTILSCDPPDLMDIEMSYDAVNNINEKQKVNQPQSPAEIVLTGFWKVDML